MSNRLSHNFLITCELSTYQGKLRCHPFTELKGVVVVKYITVLNLVIYCSKQKFFLGMKYFSVYFQLILTFALTNAQILTTPGWISGLKLSMKKLPAYVASLQEVSSIFINRNASTQKQPLAIIILRRGESFSSLRRD